MKHTPGFLAAVSAVMPLIKEVDVATVKAKLGAATLVDVREDDEWRAGRIDKAVHIGKGVIERDIETKVPDKDTELILYCGGGFRSALAAKAIADMGYTNVSSMAGGIKAWRDAGYHETK
jgi:rhodanese-related sulfurtransferase